MVKLIPEPVIDIYRSLQDAGHEVYFVGGCVRNLLMKHLIKDWDLTTSATPDEILEVFPDGFYDNTFGTVGISFEDDNEKKGLPAGRQVVEVTTYRTERGYSDRRRPDEVSWGKTIEEDLQRRDFTINAIALEVMEDVKIIDPYEGQKDIEGKLVRAVGNANERFKEDALRLLRAVRIAAELEFEIEDETWKHLVNDAGLIESVSAERVQIELLRILATTVPEKGVEMLRSAKLLDHILPELLEGIGVSQERPGRHHTSDVYTHNLQSLKFAPTTNPVVRFATLLHDVGKPKARGEDEQGLVTFYNHEIVGAQIAREICDRLKFSKKDREKIVTLIRWHMFSVDEHTTDAAIRRFIRRVGVDNVQDILDLRIGDRLGSGTQTAESWRLKKFKERVEEQLQPAPFSINDLAIDGNDIIEELQIKPGPKVGDILQKLFEEVDEDLSKNTREYLLSRLKDLA